MCVRVCMHACTYLWVQSKDILDHWILWSWSYKGVVSYLTLGAGSSRRSSRTNSESLSTELSLQPLTHPQMLDFLSFKFRFSYSRGRKWELKCVWIMQPFGIHSGFWISYYSLSAVRYVSLNGTWIKLINIIQCHSCHSFSISLKFQLNISQFYCIPGTHFSNQIITLHQNSLLFTWH